MPARTGGDPFRSFDAFAVDAGNAALAAFARICRAGGFQSLCGFPHGRPGAALLRWWRLKDQRMLQRGSYGLLAGGAPQRGMTLIFGQAHRNCWKLALSPMA